MAEIINLNQVRKARARIETRATAATKRVAHGRTKAEKTQAERTRKREKQALDGQKLED